MSKRTVQHFYIQGFRMPLSPGKVVDCDIFFRSMGYAPQIIGIDVYKPDNHKYLGWVHPEQLDFPLKRAILAYIKDNKKRWVRTHRPDSVSGR